MVVFAGNVHALQAVDSHEHNGETCLKRVLEPNFGTCKEFSGMYNPTEPPGHDRILASPVGLAVGLSVDAVQAQHVDGCEHMSHNGTLHAAQPPVTQ